MSFGTLVLVISLAWVWYPIAGAISVAAAIAEGTRPKGAGFSFLPELMIFPPLFLGAAMVIDYFAMPWGRWIVAAVSIMMMVLWIAVSVRSLIVIERNKDPR